MMDDTAKSRDQLVSELGALRHQVAQLRAGGVSRTADPVGPAGVPSLDWELHEACGSCDVRGGDGHSACGTVRKTAAAQAALAEPLELLRGIVCKSPLVLWAVDDEGVFLVSAGAGLNVLGLKAGEMVGRSVFEAYQDVPDVVEGIRRALRGETFSLTVSVGPVVFESWFAPLRGEDDEIIGVVGTAIDVTQRKKVESELLADRRLMKQLLLAHERDRRLIAYEIHDGLVQDVTGAQMQLETVLRDERLPAGLVRERVQAASELARKAIGEARHLIGGLRPPALDELGIVAALEFLVGEQSERGTKVDFVACVTFDRLEPLLEGAIYRIVQEALTNVQRHSQAFRARVRLNQVGSRLHLEIRDWGIGFDPAAVPDNRFGLDGIRERVRLVRGELSIKGDLGKGTRVFVDIPLVQSIEPVARSLEAANTTHRSIE